MTKDLALLPTGSIEAYTNAAYQVPVLTADEERDLADDCGTMTIWKPLVGWSCRTSGSSFASLEGISVTVYLWPT